MISSIGAPQQIVGTAVSFIKEMIFPQVLHLKNFMISSFFVDEFCVILPHKSGVDNTEFSRKILMLAVVKSSVGVEVADGFFVSFSRSLKLEFVHPILYNFSMVGEVKIDEFCPSPIRNAGLNFDGDKASYIVFIADENRWFRSDIYNTFVRNGN
jgi:hypothetical protein